MASIKELQNRIDLHDLADRLGLKRGKGANANYHSPHHPDKSPSIGIKKDGRSFVDYSGGDSPHSKGSCIDLIMWVQGITDIGEAMSELHDMYAIPRDKKQQPDDPPAEKSLAEFIADRCIGQALEVREYLNGRGISDLVIDRAIKAKTLGFNSHTSKKVKSGEVGHGGPAAAFIVRHPTTNAVLSVDLRFLDPAINGDVKTQSHGEKFGVLWCSDWKRLKGAARVYIVESATNALSIETADPKAVVIALRGLGNVDLCDWSFLRGKHVIICLDNDQPFADGHKMAGHRPGPEAAWKLIEKMVSLNIGAMLVDQVDWKDEDDEPINDVNDMLKDIGPEKLRAALDKFEPWLIPGLPAEAGTQGKKRVYLPGHDFAQYWKFRVRTDFTNYIGKTEEKDGEDGEKIKTPIYMDLAGFRVASLSRVSVASATSTMTGDPDNQPAVYFSVSVQTPRHGPVLQRRVMQDEQLHNIDGWKKFGPVWNPGTFSRMVNILERTADLGARHAANFVGLAWRDGELIVNEGPDCYFTEPDKQCPYHNLTFPTGTKREARQVITAFQGTFKRNAALLPLVWSLGGHLKALLGFWPHMMIQSDKGSGKSTLIKRLERAIGMTMFSGQSLQTEFRLLTSISHTSHPVGWEELSARRQEVIDKAVGMLQENYQYTVTRRGTDMTEYLLAAPVLLAGEDVPVRSLLGKIIRTDLTGKKGPMMPDDLPRFPVRSWLEFLAKLSKAEVLERYRQVREMCLGASRASGDDDGALRMSGNYAAVFLSWQLLCEYAGIPPDQGDFDGDLFETMNRHIGETSADREPWVWIMETALSEIAAGRFSYPHAWETVGEPRLLVRTSHIMDHISSSSALREKWNGLPVKSDRVFKKQMINAGVIDGEPCERTIHNRRVSNLQAMPLAKLEQFGLFATPTSVKED
ncbi:toprim domain-containing protein [Herminiimonas contaminans]|uniref:Toprim domain-containing protein n=1 Tax=Herminiimonas contaminans TaxID=1111140 RepID=A0ABS0EQ90_9BURK|nr:toprim domain-containing protein [Herminiimonas contaminans]MBF8176951.1 toprim domain-containing protein [Herminiimonas contaminans]